jgi:hypothetical protein
LTATIPQSAYPVGFKTKSIHDCGVVGQHIDPQRTANPADPGADSADSFIRTFM